MAAAGAFLARYADGDVADMRDVACRTDTSSAARLMITDRATERDLVAWAAADLFPAHGRRGELRIGLGTAASGARLVVTGANDIACAKTLLPGLAIKERREHAGQLRIIGFATVALGLAITAYVLGVPLLAGDIVRFVPPVWEKHLGDTVAAQMQATLAKDGGFAVCDPDRNSVANLAINRFANAALAGTGTPFTADVTVVRTSVPNAFALPGGKAFYFSGLLEHTQSADEFAGVLAHEMGHVVHRDGMQQLISTASTGLLIGFILGDMTGLSVAGALGTTVIDSRFSRDAERNADRFAAETATRLRFQPVGLADLLVRVARDDRFSQAMALLSTHPLTDERRLALESLRANDDASLPPAFTDSEWQAIRSMCGTPAASGPPAASGTPIDDTPAPRANRKLPGRSDGERQHGKSEQDR
jgi:hypothetical protein